MQHVQTHCNYDKHRQVTMLKFDRSFYITETEQPNTVPKFFILIIIHLMNNFIFNLITEYFSENQTYIFILYAFYYLHLA